MWVPKVHLNKLNSQTYRAKNWWRSTVSHFLVVGWIVSLCSSKYVAVEYLYQPGCWKISRLVQSLLCVTDQKGSDTAPVCLGTLLVWVELWTQDASTEHMRWDFGEIWGLFCFCCGFFNNTYYESMTWLGREARGRKQQWLVLCIWNQGFFHAVFSHQSAREAWSRKNALLAECTVGILLFRVVIDDSLPNRNFILSRGQWMCVCTSLWKWPGRWNGGYA